MVRLLISVLLGCLMGSTMTFAQSHKAFAQAGQEALADDDCGSAMDYFSNAYAKQPIDQYHFLFAKAAIQCQAFQKALPILQVLHDKEAPVDEVLFFLAECHKNLGHYPIAKSLFTEYTQQAPSGKYLVQATEEITNCNYALAQKVDNLIEVKNLGKKINSPYSEFAPTLIGDTLYYSSFRFDFRKDIQLPKRKMAKAVYSTNGRKGRPMRYHFNADDAFTANVCFLPDGSGVYYTRCQYVDGLKVKCDLYFRPARKKKGWKKPIKMDINLEQFTSTQPTYYAENQSNTSYIIFSSNRPNGRGKLDLWFAEIQADHQLAEPVNLKSINTSGNEITPFYDLSSQKLFFSSDKNLNMGGYDIFSVAIQTILNISDSITPLPRPINTEANDLFYVVNPHTNTGFLASNRTGSQFIDKQNQRCCNDLYKWTTTPKKSEPKPPKVVVAPLPTKKKPTVHTPPQPVLSTTAQTMLDLLPIRLYFDNDEPDKRTTATTTKKTYQQTYDKYIAKRSTFVRHFCQPLKGDEKENARYDIEDFFDYEVQEGGLLLATFSDLLLDALHKGETIEIILKGYTSPRAKSDYNKFLAARRIASVNNHFATFANGVFNQYLQNGQLKISELPLGEAHTPTGVSDAIWDKRMSVYSVEASSERRVEIIDLKVAKNLPD